MADPLKAKQAVNREKYKPRSKTWKKINKVESERSKKLVKKSISDPLVKEPSVSIKRSKSLVSSSGYSTLTQGTSRIIYVKESSLNSCPTQPTSYTQPHQSGVKKITPQYNANELKKRSLDKPTWNSSRNVLQQNMRCENDMSKKTTSLNSMKKCEDSLDLRRCTFSMDIKPDYHPSIFLTPPQQILHPEDEVALLQSNTISSVASFDELEVRVVDNPKAFSDIPTIIVTPPTPGTSFTSFHHFGSEKEKEQFPTTALASDNQIESNVDTINVAATQPKPTIHDNSLMVDKGESTILNEHPSFEVFLEEKEEEKPSIDHEVPYPILRRWKPILALDSDAEEANLRHLANLIKIYSGENIIEEPPLVEVTEPEITNIQFSNLLTEVDEATHDRTDTDASWALLDCKTKKLTFVRRKKRLRKFRKKAKKALRNIVKNGTRCLREGARSLYSTCNFTLDPVHFVV